MINFGGQMNQGDKKISSQKKKKTDAFSIKKSSYDDNKSKYSS
jgi:hypothetical protein